MTPPTGGMEYFLSIKSVFLYLREHYPKLVRNRALRYGKKGIGWQVSLDTSDGTLHIYCVKAHKATGRSDMGQEHIFSPKNAPKN